MQKSLFHNYPSNDEDKIPNNIISRNYLTRKKSVDVNKLLNRVRIEKKNEQKKQIIFYSITILMLFTFTFVVFS